MISAGKVIGSLSVQSFQFDAYTENDQQILSTLANQTTVALLNARLFAETQKLASTLEQRVDERTAQLEHEQNNAETLLRILTEVSSSLDLEHAMNRTLALLNDTIGTEQGMIMLLQAENNQPGYRASYGFSPGAEKPGDADTPSQEILELGENLSTWVIKNHKPLIIHDLRRDTRWGAATASANLRSALAVALSNKDTTSGVIMVFHHTANYFNNDALEMVKAISSQAAIAINNAQIYENTRDQANHLAASAQQQAETSQ